MRYLKSFPVSLKVSLPALLFLGIAGFGVQVWQQELGQVQQQAEERGQRQVETLGQRLAFLLAAHYQQNNTKQIEATMRQANGNEFVQLVVLFDANNQTLLTTRSDLKPQTLKIARDRLALFSQVRTTGKGDISFSIDRQQIQAVYPVLLPPTSGKSQSQKVGILFLQSDLTGLHHQAHKLALQRFFLYSLGLLCLWGGLWWLLDRTITRRATTLVTASQQLATCAGTTEQPIFLKEPSWRLQGSDEFAQLAIALEQFVQRLQTYQNQEIQTHQNQEIIFNRSAAIERALIHAIPDLMMRVHQDGTCLEILSVPIASAFSAFIDQQGQNLFQNMPSTTAQRCRHHLDLAFATGATQIYEFELVSGDRITHQEARISVSGPNEVLVMIRDITQQRQQEAKLQQALKQAKELSALKNRFIAMTSHEFRTPLSVILSSAEILEHFDLSIEERQEQFQQIYAAVRHMTQLLEDILFINKAEAGKLKVEPTALDLEAFCRELIKHLQQSIDRTRHPIQFLTTDLPVTTCLDAKLLRQILTNLLSNAIKYSPAGGPIDLILTLIPNSPPNSAKVRLQVRDRGIGIPPDDQARLFQSFQRASNVGTLPGTGLGLAIVRWCVEAQGGSIAVESEVGRGSVFSIEFPLS